VYNIRYVNEQQKPQKKAICILNEVSVVVIVAVIVAVVVATVCVCVCVCVRVCVRNRDREREREIIYRSGRDFSNFKKRVLVLVAPRSGNV
jgi:hypothetical protein